MANPTTNFGWVMPTSTSLVTNLPADFNTFGQAVDTSMSELLGGTTGQVLSKTSATNMDFTWVTPTDQTPLTTKGDLFTFSTVDARLAVGSNGETLVADSAATTGLRYQVPKTQNAVYNSGFDVWQRGTSVAQLGGIYYNADRWCSDRAGFDINSTTSRQATGDTTNLPNIAYCARVQRNNANTSVNALYMSQSLENLDSARFAGQTVTFSFYARKGANYSSASSALSVIVNGGTGTNENAISTWTGGTTIVSQTATLTTTWQRFTYTGTVSSSATQVGWYFYYTPVGTAGAADYYEITGVQLEVGSVATPFNRMSGSIQGELAACQRYYSRFGGTAYNALGSGVYTSTTNCRIYIPMPVTMRSTTAFTYSAGSDFGIFNGSGNDASTAVAANSLDVNSAALDFTVTARTAGYAGIANTRTNTTAYLAFSAEL
jgi:hypothetical protein